MHFGPHGGDQNVSVFLYAVDTILSSIQDDFVGHIICNP